MGPESIDASERAYLSHVQTKAKEANAAFASYEAFLSQKYNLTPGDAVLPDGQIHRAQQTADAEG